MKTAYLTIDDGPTEITLSLLDALQERAMPAVLFFIGERMEKRPEIVVEAIQRGFPVGNHSWSHPRFGDLNVLDATLEIERTETLLTELYQIAGVERSYRCFRFPYGDKADGRNGKFDTFPATFKLSRAKRIQRVLEKNGFQPVDHQLITDKFYHDKLASSIDWNWTFDLLDWSISLLTPVQGIRSLKDVLARISSSNPVDPRKPTGSAKRWLSSPEAEIILFHDAAERRDINVPILDALKALPLMFSLPPVRSLSSLP